MNEETQSEELSEEEQINEEVELQQAHDETFPATFPADAVEEIVSKEIAPETKRSIKETKEVFAVLEVLTNFTEKVFADGQVNGSDFVHILSLLKDVKVFSDAYGNISDVDDELKDLDEAELIELGLLAYSLVKKVVKAVHKK